MPFSRNAGTPAGYNPNRSDALGLEQSYRELHSAGEDCKHRAGRIKSLADQFGQSRFVQECQSLTSTIIR